MTFDKHNGAGHDDLEHNAAEHNAAEQNDAEQNDAEQNEFDCSRARLQLYEYLDGEMDPDNCTRIREHLAQCGPCLAEYDVDQMLKALVRRSCRCEAAPTQLRMQIMSRITHVTMTVEFRD